MFQRLKKAFTTAQVLLHFDDDKEITLETDASDYVSARAMSQNHDSGTLYTITLFSKKYSLVKCCNEIHNEEPMAIV